MRNADHLTEARDAGGYCDGVSDLEDGLILYRATGNRRENFTLSHELAHWLFDRAGDEVYDWLAEQQEPGKLLETICDAIAQRLVIQESGIDEVLRTAAISANDLAELHSATHARRPAWTLAPRRRQPASVATAVTTLRIATR